MRGASGARYNFFALWANDVHSLGNYSFAMGLFALGLGTWQILLAARLGSAFLFFLLCLSGFMGYKTGVPFPVMSRISFGIRGAQIPALIRGGVAIVWFGIQTYLASVVGNVLVIALFPATQPLAENTFLGLSMLGWVCFTVLWLIQVVIVSYGMEMIRKYEAFAGPVILVTIVALARMDVRLAGGRSPGRRRMRSPAARCGGRSSAAAPSVGRDLRHLRAELLRLHPHRQVQEGHRLGQLLRHPGQHAVLRRHRRRPGRRPVHDRRQDHRQSHRHRRVDPNTLLLVLACLALLILTIAVNLMANFVAPSTRWPTCSRGT